MKKELTVLSIFILAMSAAIHIQAFQQDSLKTVGLREVVITATKFPKNQTETGKVLTVIDEEQITRSRGKDLSQLLNEQVGLVVNGATSNPAKDKSVFLRGASGNYTLVLLDGIPLTDPSGVGGAFDLRMISLDQVERIEILKGSQSTLYGTDAIAGVINILTRHKGGKPLEGFGNLSYGSYNTIKTTVGATGSMEKVDYNFSISRIQIDGISEAKDKSGNGDFDRDGFHQNTLQFNLGIKPSEKITIKPFIQYSDFDGKYDAGAFTDDRDATFDSKVINTGLTSQLILEKGSLNVLYATTRTKRTFTESFGTFPYDGRFHHGEVFMNYDLAAHFQFLGGVNYQHFKMFDENASKKNPASDILSPYVSFFLKDLNGFSVELGGRFVTHSEYGSNFTYSINPSYRINHVKLFANYTTGFKTPTLSQLYGPFGANNALGPEESKNLEGGVHLVSVSKKFDIRATAFSRKIDNAIAYTTAYVNLNTLDDWGLELEPSFRFEKITVSGYYAFVDGKFTTKTQNGSETRDNDLIRRPKHSVGLTIGYQGSPALYVSLNFKTWGKRNDLIFDFDTFTNVSVVLDPYQLLDLYAEYRLYSNKLKFFADVRNLLNQSYFEVFGYNTQRLTITTGISFRL